MTHRSDVVDVAMTIHMEKERAILASDDGDSDNAVWLPRASAQLEENAGMSA